MFWQILGSQIRTVAIEVDFWAGLFVNLFAILAFFAWLFDPSGKTTSGRRRLFFALKMGGHLALVFVMLTIDMILIFGWPGPPDQYWLRWVLAVPILLAIPMMLIPVTRAFLSDTRNDAP